jgi:hypothetical protein
MDSDVGLLVNNELEGILNAVETTQGTPGTCLGGLSKIM